MVAFEPDGTVVGEARRPVVTASPRDDWYEQDAADWWEAAADALGSLTDLLQPHHLPVGLGLTHQRETFVCVDRAGQPIRPAILWLDGRARRQAEELGSPDIHTRTGKPVSAVPSLYKIAWLAEHEPDTLRRTHQVLDVHAFLAQRLTGRAVSSWASADSTGLLDLRTKEWDEDLAGACGCSPEQLPPVVAPGEIIGPILPDVIRRTGLPPGLPVVAGAGDGQCAGIGVGALVPGHAYLNLGTSISLGTYVSGHPILPGLRTMAGPDHDLHAVETLQMSGAATISWFQDRLTTGPDPRLEAQAALVLPGAHGLVFLPYLAGLQTPNWEPDARAALLGLGRRHGRPEVYRAILEGLAYDQHDCLTHLERELDVRIRRITVTGGMGRSPLAAQILAAVLPAPLFLSAGRECTALGAAVIAATALDDIPHGSLLEAAEAMTRTGDPVIADPDWTKAYESAGQRRHLLIATRKQGVPPSRRASAAP